MHKHSCITTAGIALSIFTFLSPQHSLAGYVAYQVSVNTSPLSGQVGNLDFQFNPGSSLAKSATVSVTNFQSVGGILSQPAILTGNAAGALPGTLTLSNGTFYNDIFQGFSFGTSFSFLLTLTGPAIDNPAGTFGSSFALSLYDAAGVTPLLTTDPNGSVLTVNLNANGTTSAITFPQSQTNSMPVAVATNSVPGPSTFAMTAGLFIVLYINLQIYLSRTNPQLPFSSISQ